MSAELERLRLRSLGGRTPPGELAAPGTPSFVGRVVSTSNSLAAGKFVEVNPVLVTGTEAEGGAATETVDTGTSQLVYLARGTVATNDDLICYRVPHRWVAEKKVAATCSNTITFTVTGCNNAGVSGATVTITQGGSSVSGTTDSNGQVSLAPTAGGTWAYTVSKAPRWNNVTGTFAFTCGVHSTRTITPTAATGYICCPNCVDPLSKTLVFNDGVAAVTLNYNSTLSTGTNIVWDACATRSASSVYSVPGCTTNTGAGSVNVRYQVQCASAPNGGWRATVVPASCSPDAGITIRLANSACPAASDTFQMTRSAGDTCSPLAVTFTKTWAAPYTQIYAGTPQSYTLSE